MGPMNQWLRMGLEVGPLLVFFAVNAKAGIFAATAVFMVVAVVSVGALRVLEKKWPMMPLVTAVLVLVFGGLTLWLADATFIKLKPTIVYSLFASALFVGLAMQRNFLKVVFGKAFTINEAGWRTLTWRWAWFFVVMAGVNEAVWRTQSTDDWVTFKVFGFLPMTLAFALAQMPLLRRHAVADEGDAA